MGTLKNPKKVMQLAKRFASKDASRPILQCIHLDEDGSAVATDSYRLVTIAGVWDGPSIDIDPELAAKMSKTPASIKEVEVVTEQNWVECRIGNSVVKGDKPEGSYPKYKTLLKDWSANAVAEVPAKQAAVICLAHKGDNVRVDISNGCCVMSGVGDAEPSARFDGCAEGAGIVHLNPEYFESALKACGDKASVKVMASMKPVIVGSGNMQVVVMPVRMGAAAKPKVKEAKKEEPMAKSEKKQAPKKEERMVASGLSGWVVYGTTSGGEVGWLSYSDHKTNKGAEEWLKRTAKRTDGTELSSVKAEFFGNGTERDGLMDDRKAQLKRLCGKVVTWRGGANRNTGLATTWKRPATEAVVTTAKVIPTAEGIKTEVVEQHTEKVERKPKAAAKPKAAKPEPKHDDAITVSLTYMKAWCAEREDVLATQKHEGCCIWVEGITKPYQAELKELGFRWGKSRKAWYFDPKRVTA